MYCMIDVETMGKGPKAAIVTIGAVSFDPVEGVVDEHVSFYRRVSLESSVDYGGEMDASTVRWWMEQGDGARAGIVWGGQLITTALHDLWDWYKTNEFEAVWSHGKDFDLVILTTAWERANYDTPWSYRDTRDTRTAFALAGLEYRGTRHHALLDAIDQAEAVCEAYKRLRLA